MFNIYDVNYWIILLSNNRYYHKQIIHYIGKRKKIKRQ